MGTPEAAVPTLERILTDGHEIVSVWTQPDKPVGRGGKITASAVKEFALAHNLPVFQPVKVKTEETRRVLEAAEADIAVVVAYGRILPESLLELPKLGCVNVHFSLLPKLRGAAPVNWAIINGDAKTGVTTMKMDAGLDTGDILLQRETAILPDETAVDLMARLAHEGAELLSETLTHFHTITPQPQNHEFATLAPIMRKEDGLINWNLTAENIGNRIRGFQPFPTSFTFWQSKKLTIWKNSQLSDADIEQRGEAVSGEILRAAKNELLVNCGENTVLRIEELQLEGKKRMSVRDFQNGVKINVGERLSQN